jgi:acetoacetyl-CoA synthetase
MDGVNAEWNLQLSSYKELYDWSVENIPEFWVEMWEFAGIKASKKYDNVVDDLTNFPGAKWFP